MKTITPLIITCVLWLAFFGKAPAQSPVADSLFSRAKQLLGAGDYTQAMLMYRRCFELSAAQKDSLHMGNALIGIGIANDESGRLDTALQYYFRALAVYKAIHNPIKTGGTLKNIGNLYRMMRSYDKAHDFLQQALAVQYAQKDSARIGTVLNDIGIVYMDQDSTAKATSYFRQVITRYNRYLADDVKAYTFNNLAITYAREQHYAEALQYYQSGLALMQQAHNQYGTALILGNIGDLYYKMGHYDRALEFHLRSHTIIRQIRSNQLLMTAYDNLAKTYSAMGNYHKAYDYMHAGMLLKDTIYQEESQKAYAEMEAKYQNEKKQGEIRLLQQDNRIANIELQAQQKAKYFLLIVCLLILMVTLLLYKSYTARKKANQALSNLNTRLAEADGAKAKLISIISHDLRSPVSSLFHFLQLQQMEAGKIGTEQGAEMNEKVSQAAENLLEAMEDLLLWSKTQMDRFVPAREEIDVEELLDEIIYLNEQAALNKNIILQRSAMDECLLETDPNFVRIILRNLVSNAIKFTPEGGVITLGAAQQDQQVLLTVQDNGPGISEADQQALFEWNSISSDSSGLGLKLVKEFTEKLGGRLSVVSEPGNGATFTVCLPAA